MGCIPVYFPGRKEFEHFNVEVFLSFVKGVPNQLLRALTSLFCFGIHLYLLYWSVQFFDFQKVVKSAAMEIPMAVVAAGMVLGFFLGSCPVPGKCGKQCPEDWRYERKGGVGVYGTD